MSGTSEEKDLPASDKKIQDARDKGQVAKSTELTSAAVTLVGFCYVLAQIHPMASRFIELIQSTGLVANQPLSVALRPLSSKLMATGALMLGPMLVLIVVSAVGACLFSMGGVVISMHPLIPKFETLNPVEGFKKLFSLRKLMELIKNVAKLAAIGAMSVVFISAALQPLVEQPSCGLRCAPAVMRATMMPLLIMAGVLFVIIGLADVLLQKWLFKRDQRMTKTEQKQETKNTEGDPQVKAAHKRVLREAAQARMGMRQATFTVSGSNVFVALRYSSADTRVPTVVARGEGDKATDLLKEARQQQKPIHFDSDVARMLFDTVKLGHPIDKDQFAAVINIMKALELV